MKQTEEIRQEAVEELEKLLKIIRKRIEQIDSVDPDFISWKKSYDLKFRFRVREIENEMCSLVSLERYIVKKLNYFKQKPSQENYVGYA